MGFIVSRHLDTFLLVTFLEPQGTLRSQIRTQTEEVGKV